MTHAAARRAYSHSARAHFYAREQMLELADDALLVSSGGRQRSIPLADIGTIHLYRFRVFSGWTLFGRRVRRAVLKGRFRGRVVISGSHYRGMGRAVEERSDTYRPFVRELVWHVREANPHVRILVGAPWTLWVYGVAMLALCTAWILFGASILFGSGFDLVATIIVAVPLMLIPYSAGLVLQGWPRPAKPFASLSEIGH